MVTKIGINGFGRVGRVTLRTIIQRQGDKLEVVAINDLCDCNTNAHLLKWDSTYGPYPGKVDTKEDSISLKQNMGNSYIYIIILIKINFSSNMIQFFC